MRPYISDDESVLKNSAVFPFLVTTGPVAADADVPPPEEASKLRFSVDLAVRMIDDSNGNARWVSAERVAGAQFSRFQSPPPHAASRPWQALWKAEIARRYAKSQEQQHLHDTKKAYTVVDKKGVVQGTRDEEIEEAHDTVPGIGPDRQSTPETHQPQAPIQPDKTKREVRHSTFPAFRSAYGVLETLRPPQAVAPSTAAQKLAHSGHEHDKSPTPLQTTTPRGTAPTSPVHAPKSQTIKHGSHPYGTRSTTKPKRR